MPEYIYTDGSGHRETVKHRMLYSTAVICAECGEEMRRVPQVPAVTWGGLKPSAGEYGQPFADLFANQDRRRDRYQRRLELRKQQKAEENGKDDSH